MRAARLRAPQPSVGRASGPPHAGEQCSRPGKRSDRQDHPSDGTPGRNLGGALGGLTAPLAASLTPGRGRFPEWVRCRRRCSWRHEAPAHGRCGCAALAGDPSVTCSRAVRARRGTPHRGSATPEFGLSLPSTPSLPLVPSMPFVPDAPVLPTPPPGVPAVLLSVLPATPWPTPFVPGVPGGPAGPCGPVGPPPPGPGIESCASVPPAMASTDPSRLCVTTCREPRSLIVGDSYCAVAVPDIRRG